MGISTHILDTALGRPAANVAVTLTRREREQWVQLSPAGLRTDADGRIRQLLPEDIPLDSGLYCVRFETGDYFHEQSIPCLHPYIEIAFEIPAWNGDAAPHYHIPLLLTANGYTTYRGS